jgi:hypothetical protein
VEVGVGVGARGKAGACRGAARGGHVSAGAGAGGCLQASGGGRRAGLLHPPKLLPIRSWGASIFRRHHPHATAPHGGRTCDLALPIRKSP